MDRCFFLVPSFVTVSAVFVGTDLSSSFPIITLAGRRVSVLLSSVIAAIRLWRGGASWGPGDPCCDCAWGGGARRAGGRGEVTYLQSWPTPAGT